METDGEKDAESEVAELRLKADSLKQELRECRAELSKLQKQLQQSERLQKSTESYNEDLRKQVDQLSAEIHQRKKRDKEKVSIETQTDEYEWTETDYYNYYYGSYYQNPGAADTQDGQGTAAAAAAAASAAASAAAAAEAAAAAAAAEAEAGEATTSVDGTNGSPAPEMPLPKEEAVADGSAQPDGTGTAEVEGDPGSIADMLRATAEEAMTQTGFVFDETTGMYYDHSTGFYYDSASQLYYDANTGFYYYYDAESGRYQFHSRIEVPAAQTSTELYTDALAAEKRVRKFKKGVKKPTHLEDKEQTDIKLEKQESDWVEKKITKTTTTTTESGKLKRRSRSTDGAQRREESDESSSKKKKHRNGSRHSDEGWSKKKKKKSKSEKRKKKKKKKSPAKREDSEGNSEPEEGEITESERDESTPSFSSGSPDRESPESEMETQSQAVNDIWPPCVRVTVVRSPVLQVGTLFIITADSPATIGREKDMDHAIRIPEMGVSKLHAEVHFDEEQQSYVLVDQGSQNGTVINGNRILQPKAICEPHTLMHGDEVKMGETVLSFHIHPGTDTCDGCEPGQVMAHIGKHRREEQTCPSLTKEDKEALRQKELKQMKAKYGLQTNEFEEAKTLKNPKYKDRAQSRRLTVGSEGVFQRDDAPASVHEEISEVNKGRKMLEKMGWKKGEGLGKEGTGMKTPIELKIRKSQSGLGASAALSLDAAAVTKSKSQKNWEKARERFAGSCQSDAQANPTQNPSPNAWVKAEETESTDTRAEAQE